MHHLIENCRDEFLILALLYPEFEKALLEANTDFFADEGDIVATEPSTQTSYLSAEVQPLLVAALDPDFVPTQAGTDSAPNGLATSEASGLDAEIRPASLTQTER